MLAARAKIGASRSRNASFMVENSPQYAGDFGQ